MRVATSVMEPPTLADSPNHAPQLLCEGTCTGHTPHTYVGAFLRTWQQGYDQRYACQTCHTVRVWGRTIMP